MTTVRYDLNPDLKRPILIEGLPGLGNVGTIAADFLCEKDAIIANVYLFDIIVANAASTDSNWIHQYGLNGHYSAGANFDLVEAAVNAARKRKIPVHVGNVLSSDVFYNADKEGWKKWADMNVLAVEMEAFSLYCNAAKLKKKALCLLTVSDSFLIKDELTPEQRQTGLLRMIEIGIETAEQFAK